MNPVVESMRQDWLGTRQDWSSKIMRSAAAKGRIFAMSGYLIMVGCYFGFAVSPFLGFNIRMVSNITDYGGRHMLVQSYYPYDYSKSPIFELTFGSQLVAGIFIGLSVSVPDNYFAALMFHYSAQFEILGARVEQLIRDDCSLDAESHFFSENWPGLVDRHVHLMTLPNNTKLHSIINGHRKLNALPILVSSRLTNNYNWAVGLNRWSLRLMGIWPGERQQYLRVPFMIGIIFFCLFLPQMYALVLVMQHLPLVIDNLLTSCAALTSCFKLLFFWQNRQGKSIYITYGRRKYSLYTCLRTATTVQVLDLVIESMRKDWLRGCMDQRTRKTMLKAASRARLITTLDYSVMASCYAGFVVAPLLGFDLRTSNNITDYPPGGRKLLVQSYYPFDYSASPTFELAYFLQLVGSFFVGMAVSIPDDYFGALILHASAQFSVLAARIDGLIDEVTTTRDCSGPAAVADRSDPSTINRRLGRLVDRHVHLYS
ncbi:unnamed protein product [Trichogramma brassicae]|uniref:Odorant receptor n=1 Tax=Trichogramma brassicae TaxID=86971 RepID=A0A6H5IAW0_9HYME|nr:unnamed protein product [Trichogramma brassicae]